MGRNTEVSYYGKKQVTFKLIFSPYNNCVEHHNSSSLYNHTYLFTNMSAASLVIFFFANIQNCFFVKEAGIVGFILLVVLA